MRRLWLVLGFALGAVFVWALTHDDRKLARAERDIDTHSTAFDKEARMALARRGAIDGVDYLGDEYWEEELAQYKDVYEAWERGDFDEHPLE